MITLLIRYIGCYTRGYQESLKMTTFEALYGQRYHTPLNWIEPREKMIFGPDLIEEAEVTVSRIQDNLRAVKSCQESNANKRCCPIDFEVGNHVYLKVSPMRGVKRFDVKGKLAPHYIRPFPILEKCGIVAYKLELSSSFVGVHDIFHISQLKKCLKAPVDVVLLEVAPLLIISRASDQDPGSKGSCHKAQDPQVFEDSMEQPYRRRNNLGE
jgi:hypothetical protein